MHSPDLSSAEAFGPNLRRTRLRRGVPLEHLVRETNVSLELWEGLERNDFSGWPSGIYARSWVAAYARMVGLDAVETVNEFCRCFPNGDRRGETVMRDYAHIVGHNLTWDQQLHSGPARRKTDGVGPVDPPPTANAWRRLRLAIAAGTASMVLTFRRLAHVRKSDR